jgi:predicted Rossmann-fold nucleotide-binding protein
MSRNGLLEKAFPRERRTAITIFRSTPTEKDSLRAAALSVGKTLTAYLLGLHQHYTGGGKGVARAK